MMNYNFDDTIAAPATLPGTGAITIVRVSGPDTFEVLDKIIRYKSGTTKEFSGYTIHFGTVVMNDGSPLDEVLVSIFRAPNSYTGEDSAEISIHASEYICRELMLLLSEKGVRSAEPGEFTRRAYINNKMDLAQAEAVADIISSQTSAAHRIAFNQLRGGYSKELSEMRAKLLDMLALMELELDFSEEDVEFANRSQLSDLLKGVLSHINKLVESFKLGNAIKNGVPVAIVGSPNTGKSTLLNALLGEERAIVSNIPGTTRDTIEEKFNIGGVLYRLIDTAGIRETDETIEKLGIERSLEKLSQADIVLGMVDVSEDENRVMTAVQGLLSKCDLNVQKIVILLNKIDVLEDKNSINKNVIRINDFVKSSEYKEYSNNIHILPLSAAKNEGVDELKGILGRIHSDISTGSDTNMVTNIRHYDALIRAASALKDVENGLASSLPTDLVAQDLHDAVNHLSSITGMAIDEDMLLGHIFSRFCIGK